MSTSPDVQFFFDPVCPFAWITSRWVLDVSSRRDLDVDWRFICLSVVNEDTDYSRFPPAYPAMHGLGRDLLRVAAAARDDGGNDAVSRFYTAAGERLHVGLAVAELWRGNELPADLVPDVLAAAGLDRGLASAAADAAFDPVLREETALALSRTGDDVGTPILTFAPGTDAECSLFGPVISKAPAAAEADAVWDAVTLLAATSGFAELKRSLRDPLDFT